ncbi:MAG: hypothetical protein ACXW13_06115 [Burkholderiaceae bacterium]
MAVGQASDVGSAGGGDGGEGGAGAGAGAGLVPAGVAGLSDPPPHADSVKVNKSAVELAFESRKDWDKP